MAAARAKAEECRNIIGSGGDPKTDLAERKAAVKVATFGTVADEYRETMAPKWKSDKTAAKWKRFAEINAKAIRKVPVSKISKEDVLKVVRPMWADKPDAAGYVRECVKLVLDHAKARGLRSGDNPAQWPRRCPFDAHTAMMSFRQRRHWSLVATLWRRCHATIEDSLATWASCSSSSILQYYL